jgi:hypothetical protein
MSQTIVSRVIGSVTDKRASLSNGQLVRYFGFLDNWNVIRIGMQFSFNNTVDIIGTPRLAFGIVNGVDVDAGFGAAATRHFLGVASSPSATTWTFNAGPPAYNSHANSWRSVKKIGATETLITNANAIKASAAPTSARSVMMIQFVKGAPNYTIDFVTPNTVAAVQTDITDSLFQQMMEALNMSDANSIVSGYAASGAQAVAIDTATNGVFDALNIYWDKTAANVEVSQVRFRKIS